jgi:hypothetical protein
VKKAASCEPRATGCELSVEGVMFIFAEHVCRQGSSRPFSPAVKKKYIKNSNGGIVVKGYELRATGCELSVEGLCLFLLNLFAYKAGSKPFKLSK